MTGTLPMGGQVIAGLGLGSAAIPAISFVGAASTGLYAPAAGQLGLSIAGVAALTINASRQVTIPAPVSGTALTIGGGGASVTGTVAATAFSGDGSAVTALNASNLTTGTIPVARINGGTSAQFVRGDGVYTNTLLGAFTVTPASGQLSINSTGNVTISAPASGTGLTINGGGIVNANGVFNQNRTNVDYNVVDLLNTSGVQVQLNANGNSEGNLRTVSNHPLTFSTNNTQRVAIAAAGNVTISAPGSGNVFAARYAGNDGLTVGGGGTARTALHLGSTVDSAGVNFAYERASGVGGFYQATGPTALGTAILTWSVTRNVTVEAPTSGGHTINAPVTFQHSNTTATSNWQFQNTGTGFNSATTLTLQQSGASGNVLARHVLDGIGSTWADFSVSDGTRDVILRCNAGGGRMIINGNQVVTARRTGWTAQTAAASRADLGASPSVGQLASFCRALYDDLAAHGLIGA